MIPKPATASPRSFAWNIYRLMIFLREISICLGMVLKLPDHVYPANLPVASNTCLPFSPEYDKYRTIRHFLIFILIFLCVMKHTGKLNYAYE